MSSRMIAHASRLASLIVACCLTGNTSAEPTWHPIAEMSAEDQTLFDPSTSTPRDAAIPYLPAEPYPFTAPYTAEEMGYRLSEFPHISRWSHAMIDVFGVITTSGYINQGEGVTYITQATEPGLGGYLREMKPGDVHSRWLFFNTFPPEAEAEQQLWVIYRSDPKFTTKMDFFVYSPQMRRVRRQPQPRRDQRFPDNAQTFDDIMSRDPWELEWKLLGTDVLYETVRYPNTRATITLNDGGQGFVEHKTSDIKPMSDAYPHYRADGGVDCWVVMGVIKKDLVPNYNEKYLIFWLDKHSFYPIRTEKYGHDDQLIMIEVRNTRMENPALKEFGYGANNTLYWDVEHDIMSYSFHDAHTVHDWSEEDKNMIFTPEFMRRQWQVMPLKSQALIENPEHYFLRPHLDREKFPDARKIVLAPEVEARYAAQESAGHLVFDVSEVPAAK